MTVKDQIIQDAMSRAYDILAEACPDHGFVIAMVLANGKMGGALSYATNVEPNSLRAIGEALSSDDWDGIPDPPKGVAIQ